MFVQPFPPSGAIYQAPKVLIDLNPMWSPDGRELMYIPALASAQLASVQVAAREGLTFGVPVTSPFWIIPNSSLTQPRAYDVLPDGRFVGLIDASEADGNETAEIRVVLNWFEELKARVQPGRVRRSASSIGAEVRPPDMLRATAEPLGAVGTD